MTFREAKSPIVPENALLKEWSASKVRLEPETSPSTNALEILTFKLPLPDTSETNMPERLIVPSSVRLISPLLVITTSFPSGIVSLDVYIVFPASISNTPFPETEIFPFVKNTVFPAITVPLVILIFPAVAGSLCSPNTESRPSTEVETTPILSILTLPPLKLISPSDQISPLSTVILPPLMLTPFKPVISLSFFISKVPPLILTVSKLSRSPFRAVTLPPVILSAF